MTASGFRVFGMKSFCIDGRVERSLWPIYSSAEDASPSTGVLLYANKALRGLEPSAAHFVSMRLAVWTVFSARPLDWG